MREIGHFIGGKTVKGTSGRFGDMYKPRYRGSAGQGQRSPAVPGSKGAIANAARRASPPGGDQSAAPRTRDVQFPRTGGKEFDELADLLSSEHGKFVADARGDVQRGSR